MSDAGWAALGLFSFWAPPREIPPVPLGGELAAPPVLIWSSALPGQAPNSSTRAEPGGVAVDGDHLYVGYSGADALLVLDRHDGHLLGSLPTKGPVASTPVVTEQYVYATDRAGYTWAWKKVPSRLTGLAEVEAWSHFSGSPITASPAVEGGTVYVANLDDQVFAIDALNGTVRWRHARTLDASRGASLELMGAPTPSVRDGMVYAGFSDGFVAALGVGDGEPAWTASVGQGTYPDIIAPPVSTGSAVIVGGFTGPLVALDGETRTPAWRIDAGSSSPLLLEGETLWQGGTDGVLRKVNARTGEVLWSWDSLTGGTLTTPVHTPLGMLVASSVGTVWLVDETGGLPVWHFDPGILLNGVTARPTVADGEVFVVTNAGVVYALRGKVRPRVSAAERTPWVVGGR